MPLQKMFSYKVGSPEGNWQGLCADNIANHIMIDLLFLVKMTVGYALKLKSSTEDN